MEIITAQKQILKNKAYLISCIVLSIALFGVNLYLLFQSSISWSALWALNSFWFNLAQIILNLILAALASLSLISFVYILRKKVKSSNSNILSTFFALFISSATTGCYVCGSVIAPAFFSFLSLSSLPFGGLELKLISILLLLYALREYSKSILGICKVDNQKFVSIKDGKLQIVPKWRLLLNYKDMFIILFLIGAILLLPKISEFFKMDFTNHSAKANEYSCNTK